MSKHVSSFSHIESPAPGARIAAGWHAISGWVWPGAGGLFVDVRARVGERLFPGVHGLPRADLAAHFATGRPWALAGFSVRVELHPGNAHVILEVLAIEGCWTRFAELSCPVDSTLPNTEGPLPAGPLRWLDFQRAVHAVLRHAHQQPLAVLDDLADTVVADLPHPRDLRHAPAPLIGFIDEPVALAGVRHGRIVVGGHLFHPSLNITRVLGSADLHTWQALDYGRPSPGPGAYYADFPRAARCGFSGLVDVPAQLPNPVSLRLYAELEDGSLQLAQVVRTRLHSHEEMKRPCANRTGVVAAALVAVEAALARHSLPLHRDAELESVIAALKTEARPRGTTSAPRPTALRPATTLQPRALPRSALLATHGLTPQGAPRFLLDLARALSAGGVRLRIVSAGDGALRQDFEALGAQVTVVELEHALRAASLAEAEERFASALRGIDWQAHDIVVANTFTTFWAVHAARAAQRPALLYVHESTPPAEFYAHHVSPAIIALAEDSFTAAKGISFTTAATAAYHTGRQWLAPGWIDVGALDRWREAHDRAICRDALGVRAGEFLVCNIGTVSDRKGQHAFVRAVDLFARRHPALAARTRFILLGGSDGPFDAMLADVLRGLGVGNLAIHPETTDHLRYYHAADLLACSSYEESSPRVVLEAMAWGLPIMASAVHGIPELVRSGQEALLLPAGDTVAWAEGLARLLNAPGLGRDLAAGARARVVENFDAVAVLPQHLALIATLAAEAE